MAEAAAANGIPKKIIPHEVAQYTADAVQNPVRQTCCIPTYPIRSWSYADDLLAQLLSRVPARVRADCRGEQRKGS